MTSSADYKQLLDSLSTAIALLDRSLKVIHLNSACEFLLGISSKKAKNTLFSRYFHESNDALDKLHSALEDDEQYIQRKVVWGLHTGKHITVDYTVTPLSERKNEKGQLLVEIQELDRLLRISREEALLASQNTTKNLLRGLAHEVKNPLAGIRGAAQLLDKQLLDKQLFDEKRSTNDLQEYTHIIIAEADRLTNLVDRMLGSHQPAEIKPINLHEVLEHVIRIVNAETKGTIPVVRNYDPSIPEVPGDIERLIQALLNVVRNAVQALTENTDNQQPLITLSTYIKRQFTIGRKHYPLVSGITITDNGPGIPKKIIDDIFYPMISGRANGTGLGLAIAQQLITQHDGLIECTSEPGNTSFSIYIPLENKHD